MASPGIVSSIKHLRYFTLECYFICISPYCMLSSEIFLFLNLEAKSIDFFLSSPKWILSLLSTNRSHVLEKSTINCFSIVLISLCRKTRHESSAYRNRWHLTACDMPLTSIKTGVDPN